MNGSKYTEQVGLLRLETGKFLGEVRRAFDVGGLIVSETAYRRRVFEGWHAHENFHLSLIVRGGNRERRKTRDVEAAPGQILFYRRGELHRNAGTRLPSKNINLEIKDSFLEQYQAHFSGSEPDAINGTDTKFALLKIYKECLGNDRQTVQAIHALALFLLGSAFGKKTPAKKPSWIDRLREIINDRWDEVLSLNELSRLVGVHPVTISKNFPKYFSCTLGEYSRKIKLEKAIALIGRQKHSLADVAFKCGFADQSHLTRALRAVTGFTPRELDRF